MPKLPDFEGGSGLDDPGPGASMTCGELGEHLAHLAWETFTDFLLSDESTLLWTELGVSPGDGMPEDRAGGELLIFFLWAHTRAVQQAYLMEPGEQKMRRILNAFHEAIFADMEEEGMADFRLPIFEQRVSARYFEYHHAAEESEKGLGRTAASHVGSNGTPTTAAANLLVLKAKEITGPLRDFLEHQTVVRPTS